MDPFVAEKLENEDALHLPPVLAVRRNRYAPAVVEKLLEDFVGRPVREGEVVVANDVACGIGGGDDEDGGAAEAEVHQGAVLLGKGMEGAVR